MPLLSPLYLLLLAVHLQSHGFAVKALSESSKHAWSNPHWRLASTICTAAVQYPVITVCAEGGLL